MNELTEVHRVLADIRATTAETRTDMAWVKAAIEKGDDKMADHAKRIGSLERWRTWIAGISAGIGALFGASTGGQMPKF